MNQGYSHPNSLQMQQQQQLQQQQQQQQHQMAMGDYNAQMYQDPNDFGGAIRQDFSLDDLNFDPAYMMDNNGTDDLAVSIKSNYSV